jgi:hypothetical protein
VWLHKPRDKMNEDAVDLRRVLPRDMTGLRIHFVVSGPQLYVYQIDSKPRPRLASDRS